MTPRTTQDVGMAEMPEAVPSEEARTADRLRKLLDLIDELCEAVDAESSDIGGQRGSLTILREIGPLVAPCRAAIARQVAR